MAQRINDSSMNENVYQSHIYIYIYIYTINGYMNEAIQ